ncbi:hypothetical protein ACQKNO_00385 [Bacillus paramycoides]|uniref:hypothetical protein n=1 Tax=Bacillus paramycoides TaxID=2026194 RepID=UPI003D081576
MKYLWGNYAWSEEEVRFYFEACNKISTSLESHLYLLSYKYSEVFSYIDDNIKKLFEEEIKRVTSLVDKGSYAEYVREFEKFRNEAGI